VHFFPVSGSSKEAQRVIEFIQTHLAEEITVDTVRNSLKLGWQQFYGTRKEFGAASLPILINDLRLEKAKALRKDG